jgi:lipopolysaccharide transport system permease protein
MAESFMNQWLNLFWYQYISELRSRYLGSVLGVLWAFMNPLIQVGMYVFLFAIVFKVRLKGTGSPTDYVLFILSTMIGWLPFQESLLSAAGSITRNGSIIRNVVFPREIFPAASVVCSTVTWAMGLIIYTVFSISMGKMPSATWMALPLILVVQIILLLGVSFFIAIIGAFYRDILVVLPIFLQLLLISTPIFYGIEDLPASLKLVASLNPLTYLFQSYRDVLFYGIWPNFITLVCFSIFGGILFYVSIKMFRRFSGYFEAVV